MVDHTLSFEDLVGLSNLRSKTYTVQERGPLAAVDLSARRSDDWYFARRWVCIEAGRRLLYHLLDQAENAGFRFQVTRFGRLEPRPVEAEGRWALASRSWAALTEEERRLHRSLFPEEERLLGQGYDWDDHNVYVAGQPLQADSHGRLIERRDGIVYEWVKILDEYTWRRYPIGRSIEVGPAPDANAAPSAPNGPASTGTEAPA